jgi:hypothetical protein
VPSARPVRSRLPAVLLAAAALASPPAVSAADGPPAEQPAEGLALPGASFRLRGEIKANFRHSVDLVYPYNSSLGPLVMETVSPGSSFEISTVNLIAEGDLSDGISAKIEVHVLDLYNRNPTSSDDRIALREAWVRFGRKFDAWKPIPGPSLYVEVGKFPRFSKQVDRSLESYGLWGTAVGRFEEVGLEAGGTVGKHLYWRAQAVNGNPLFLRDPNALAGDNGTDETQPGSTTPPIYNSGFPIPYDAKAADVNFGDRFQVGGGLGFRLVSEDGTNGVDVLAWGFRRRLQESVPIRGSSYHGDVDLLEGVPPPAVTLDGRTKWEAGGNLRVRLGPLRIFGQYVYQDIAGLSRRGVEVEAGWRIPLNGLFALGDSPVLNWLQPDVRYSELRNNFAMPPLHVAPEFAWDWKKLDFGLRLGIVRGVDVTAEYSRDYMWTRRGWLHPDEFSVTVRTAF